MQDPETKNIYLDQETFDVYEGFNTQIPLKSINDVFHFIIIQSPSHAIRIRLSLKGSIFGYF